MNRDIVIAGLLAGGLSLLVIITFVLSRVSRPAPDPMLQRLATVKLHSMNLTTPAQKLDVWSPVPYTPVRLEDVIREQLPVGRMPIDNPEFLRAMNRDLLQEEEAKDSFWPGLALGEGPDVHMEVIELTEANVAIPANEPTVKMRLVK